MVDQEASLSVGLGKLAANRNLVGLCELLRLCAFFSLLRLLIAVALKGEPFTYAGSGIAQWPANDADRLKKAPLGPLMYSWPNRGLITKSKPSRWAAVSSSRNDFAKHEVMCLHVPRKNFESRGGYELLS